MGNQMGSHNWKNVDCMTALVSAKTGIANARVFYQDGKWKWFATCICGKHTKGSVNGKCNSKDEAMEKVELVGIIEKWD